MRATQRQQKIIELLKQNNAVTVTDLAAAFAVSENTIRNDLDTLAAQGLVERTHGGAATPNRLWLPQLRPKTATFSPKAATMVAYALSWIEDGDTLILDDSPLCVLLAEQMAHFRNLRVITPSLAAAYALVQEPSNTVILAGGELDSETLATSGGMVVAAIRDFYAGKAFFSCTGVSIHSGLTENTTESAELKRQMKNAADAVFVLIDSERVDKTDLFHVAELHDARRIVTDDGLSAAAAQALADKGAIVTVCYAGGHQTHHPRPIAGRKLRIGFANLSDGVWFAQAVRRGLEEAAQQMPDVEVLIADNQNKMEVAVQNTEWFLRQGIDLLIEYDGSGMATKPIRRMMRLAEVPVIAVDIPMVAATHFGCDHDAAGVAAGNELGRWIQNHWNGQIDLLLLITNVGGGTIMANRSPSLEDWTGESYPGALTPATRLSSAFDAIREHVTVSEVQKLQLAGDWVSSEEAIAKIATSLSEVLSAIPREHHIAAICLVPEDALGFTQAVRHAGRCGQFAVVTFGNNCLGIREELSRPDSCLIGMVDLHAERYGEGLLRTALRLLNGEVVPPAVFVEHSFLPRNDG